VPSLAQRVADDLIKQGFVRRPKIGVRVQDVATSTPRSTG
jgi:S1-C subfamily serine protease